MKNTVNFRFVDGVLVYSRYFSTKNTIVDGVICLTGKKIRNGQVAEYAKGKQIKPCRIPDAIKAWDTIRRNKNWANNPAEFHLRKMLEGAGYTYVNPEHDGEYGHWAKKKAPVAQA